MRILVTGGAGFIGHHLVRRLLANGYTVRVLDDFSSGSPANLPTDPALEIAHGCVTDRAALGDAVRGVERIFHLASVVGQIKVVEQPGWAAEVNRASVTYLNEFAPDTPLILFSSSAVYGLTGDALCQEDGRVSNDTARAYDGGVEGYGYGKWLAERIAGRRRAGSWLAVRPFNVIGPGQASTYGMVVPRFVHAALLGQPYTIYGSGDQSRSFCDVSAFIDHLLALDAAWAEGRATHQVYNIGTATETSIGELADIVDAVLGIVNARRHIAFADAYPGKQDVARRRPGLGRIHDLLGPLAWPPLEQSIRAVADTIRGKMAGDHATMAR